MSMHFFMHVCRTCSLNILKLKQPQKSSVICPTDLYLCVSHILIKYIELKISIYWEMLLQVNKHINGVFHL